MVIGFNKQFVAPILNGDKVHTLRDDKTERWIAGRSMQMATGVRTKNYNCFKEDTCKSTQEVVLQYKKDTLIIKISGRKLNAFEVYDFVRRDGFKSNADFVLWFFPKGSGIQFKKLIHWTDLKY